MTSKNYGLEIKPIQNGYVVERSWQVYKDADDELSYSYRSEKYMLKTWTDVVEWVKNNELEVAPKAS